jgi:hypothetical protein
MIGKNSTVRATASLGNAMIRGFRPQFAAVAVLAALAWSNPLAAAPMTYTWTMSGSHGPLDYGNQLEFSASEDSSRKLKVRSYSSTGTGANLVDAYTDLFGGGIGVSNQFESTGSPNHAIDNSGSHNDLVLFEFDSDEFNAESFQIGWSTNDSDIRIWVGGSGAGLDLEGMTIDDLENSLDFTQLPDFWNVATNTSVDLGTSLTGRYMVVTGGNETYKDYFKFKQIVATVDDPEDVPEPDSIALFAMGLAGFGIIRNRRSEIARN